MDYAVEQASWSAARAASFIHDEINYDTRMVMSEDLRKRTSLTCTGLLAFALLILATAPAYGSGGGAKALPEGVNYIAVAPALIVNYGGPGRMRYIKAELSIRAESSHDATEITHHLPLVRDRLISILSTQTEEEISTPEGKERLKILALSEINKVIHAAEKGDPIPSLPLIAMSTTSASHDEHKQDTHSQDEHADKKHAKEEHKKETHGSAEGDDSHGDDHASGPATDLLFNNFVVQK